MTRVTVDPPTDVDRALRRFVSRAGRRLAAEIIGRLQETTPKDTSWAAANWIAGKGSQPGAPSGPVEGREAKAAAVPSVRQTQAASIASVVTGWNFPQDGSIYIVNGVPYIGRLNEGSSRQAPAGFVQRSITGGLLATGRAIRRGV